jgi:hypothetical protein
MNDKQSSMSPNCDSVYEESTSGYEKLGLSVYSDFFPAPLICDLVRTFWQRLGMQAYKLRVIEKLPEDGCPSADEIDLLVKEVNNKSKAALDFVVQSMRETPAAFSLMSEPRFLKTCCELLRCPRDLLKIHMDGVLINLPSNETRLYKFHSEQHYYPTRRNFLNLWVPLIRAKTKSNGAMVVKLGAHTSQYTFVEYTGFNEKKSDSISEENYFHQLQIPEEEISMFPDCFCTYNANTAVFFHQNVPHTSTVNISNEVSYALIVRIYDYRFDPTLSDITSLKSYTQAAARGGYPNLRPFPFI